MRQHLANVFAKRPDAYAGVETANASHFGGALWFLGALLTAILLPIVPPTDPIGDAGWAIAVAIVLGAVLAGWRMRTAGADVNVDELLLFSYLAIIGIAVLVWLTDGIESPYAQLYVLSAIYTSAVHPPRRVLAYLGGLLAVRARTARLRPADAEAPGRRADNRVDGLAGSLVRRPRADAQRARAKAGSASGG